MTKREIQKKYDLFASWFDFAEAIPELLGVRRLRRELLQRASEKVLEIGVGTGKNLPYYLRTCHITAVDLSSGMLEIARKRAEKLGLNVAFAVMDTEDLQFPDQSFDTVVDTLSLCTYSDPVRVLHEMARVCRADGRILLLEHGRSNRNWLGRWQDRRAESHAKRLACQWNREPLGLVRQAGLPLIEARETFFGIFHLIEAAVPKTCASKTGSARVAGSGPTPSATRVPNTPSLSISCGGKR